MLQRYFADLEKRKGVKNMLHMEALWQGEHWFIARNEYPYDRVAAKHDLLIPIRVFAEGDEMTIPEIVELNVIKRKLAGDYDSVMENTHRRRTVRGHYHLHLIKYKHITDYNHG